MGMKLGLTVYQPEYRKHPDKHHIKQLLLRILSYITHTLFRLLEQGTIFLQVSPIKLKHSLSGKSNKSEGGWKTM